MKKIKLAELDNDIDGIIPSFGKYMMDCASYCFMANNNYSGINLNVKTNKAKTEFILSWDAKMTNNLQMSMNDHDRATDFGAMGMAILYALNLTNFSKFEMSKKGTGFDIWMYESKEDYENLNIENSVRLEVSGIFKTNRGNTIRTRVNVKLKQVQKSDNLGIDAFIAVTEFSLPSASFIKK